MLGSIILSYKYIKYNIYSFFVVVFFVCLLLNAYFCTKNQRRIQDIWFICIKELGVRFADFISFFLNIP